MPNKSGFLFTFNDDVRGGLQVVVVARWILVLAGLMLTLWEPGEASVLRTQITAILVLAVGNFYLHSQLLRGQPLFGEVALGASLVDIVIISILVGAQGGFESGVYVFYFPALLAISVAFSTAFTASLTTTAVILYASIALTMGGAAGQASVVVLVRLAMMVGVAVCGNFYWRIERGRIAEPDDSTRSAPVTEEVTHA